MPHTRRTNLIYMITQQEIWFTDKPRDIPNLGKLILPIIEMRTAGLDVVYEPTKTNLSANQKGYDTFEITVGKVLARRIQLCLI